MTRPLYQDEVQFVTYSDSPKNGPRITLRLPDRDMLNPFIGKDGKRFACVLVEIGDDEQPVDAPAKAEPAAPALPKGGRWAKEAGMMCADKAFQRQVEQDHPDDWFQASRLESDRAAIAAEVIRRVCEIASRAQLDSDADALARFNVAFRRKYLMLESGIAP